MIRDQLILTAIIAMIVNTGLYLERVHDLTGRKARATMKKSAADLERINAQLRGELEQLRKEFAAEQTRRRAIIARLRLARS